MYITNTSFRKLLEDHAKLLQPVKRTFQINYAAMFENKDVDPFYKETNVSVCKCCLQESYRLHGDQQYCLGCSRKMIVNGIVPLEFTLQKIKPREYKNPKSFILIITRDTRGEVNQKRNYIPIAEKVIKMNQQ